MMLEVECHKCRNKFQMDYVSNEFISERFIRSMAICDQCAGIGRRQQITPQLPLKLKEARLPYND